VIPHDDRFKCKSAFINYDSCIFSFNYEWIFLLSKNFKGEQDQKKSAGYRGKFFGDRIWDLR